MVPKARGYKFVGDDAEDKPFHCLKCGRKFGSEGAWILHNRTHTAAARKEQQEQQKQEKDCQHSWRLLDRNNEQEQKAILAGYSSVCKICDELQ